MDWSVLEEKSSFKMLGLTFSSKLDKVPFSWGCYVLYKSTIQPCMKCCCHFWAGTPSCYLKMLDKLQKSISRIFVSPLNASLEPSAYQRNIVFSIGITLVDIHLKWFDWFHFLYLKGGLLVILKDCMIFLSAILRCYKEVYINSSFLVQLDSGICAYRMLWPMI